jgi:hypothetical protein
MQQCVTGSQKSGADFFVLKKFIAFVLLTSHQKHRLKKIAVEVAAILEVFLDVHAV